MRARVYSCVNMPVFFSRWQGGTFSCMTTLMFTICVWLTQPSILCHTHYSTTTLDQAVPARRVPNASAYNVRVKPSSNGINTDGTRYSQGCCLYISVLSTVNSFQRCTCFSVYHNLLRILGSPSCPFFCAYMLAFLLSVIVTRIVLFL